MMATKSIKLQLSNNYLAKDLDAVNSISWCQFDFKLRPCYNLQILPLHQIKLHTQSQENNKSKKPNLN